MEIPNDITHLANRLFESGYAERSDSFRQVYTGPVINGVPLAWDVTEYQPHGPKSHVLDDINKLVRISDWEKSINATQVDMNYAKEICLQRSKPALVLTFEHPITKRIEQTVADGNHRIAKAAMERMTSYPAHCLSLEETRRIQLPPELAMRAIKG